MLSPEQKRLATLAKTQTIDNPDVAKCWQFVAEAFDSHQLLGPYQLPQLIRSLEKGNDEGYNEISFDWVDDDNRVMEVSFVQHAHACPGDELIAELKRLFRRYHNIDDSSPAAADATPSEGGFDLLGFVAGLFGTTAEQLVDDPDAYRTRQRETLSTARNIMTDMISEDPKVRDRANKQLSQFRDQLTRTGIDLGQNFNHLPDKIREAIKSASHVDASSIAGMLHLAAQWIEKGDAESGKRIDQTLAALEKTLGPILQPDKELQEQQRGERIRKSARDAIAARLKHLKH